MPETDIRLTLFEGKDRPDVRTAYIKYQRGLDYNNQLNLSDIVRVNENFYIGKQWEGVESNGLPTPIINIMKRVVGYCTSTIASENIKANVVPLRNIPAHDDLLKPVDILQKEFDALVEINGIPLLLQEQCRSAMVDGDCGTFTYWDPDAETGQDAKGAIKTELVDNTRLFFGNPADRRVQNQPYIQIATREPVRNVMLRAKDNDSDWTLVRTDEDDTNAVDSAKRTDGLTTVILTMWKEDGEVWCYESTQTAEIRKPWNLGIRLYPVTWFSWDRVKDSYHGQAMLTGLVPNQIAINKLCAMIVLSSIKMGFPKWIYDGTRITKLDNRVGSAIKVNGGDVNNVIKCIDPAPVSPQMTQLVEMLINLTEQSLGATSVALGDTRPDNTSAIIALKRSASTPLDLPKEALYDSGEDLFRIYLEFIAEYYGTRYVDIEPTGKMAEVIQFAMQAPSPLAPQQMPEEIPMEFDYSIFKEFPMRLKIDIGTSSFFSEQESYTTLNNLLQQGMIDIVDFLERISSEFVPDKDGLLKKYKAKQAQAEQMQMMQSGMMPPPGPPQPEAPPEAADAPGVQREEEVKAGKGNGELQRKINAEGASAAV